MEYLTLPTAQIKEWPGNLQTYTQTDIDLVKEEIEKKPQFKPLIVTTSDEANIYWVLAGNKRLKAYTQLGVERIWIKNLEFFQKDDGLWYVKVDGVESADRYQSKEDGMQDWSLIDQGHVGQFDWDKFANTSESYTLDWSKYMMGTKNKRISTALNEFLMTDKIAKASEIECPSCHFVADKKDFKKPLQEGGE